MAANRILQLNIEKGELYIPKASDDLESVVKCVFHRAHFGDIQEILIISERQVILEFWEKHLAPEFWRNMLKDAQSENYEGLKHSIAKILV